MTVNRQSHEISPVRPPELPDSLAERSLGNSVQAALSQGADIEGALFIADEAVGFTGGALEFSGCRFEKCTFADWDFRRISFVDCVFDHCDFSSLRLANVTFQRVSFTVSRLTGAEFLQASLTNVLFTECTAGYFALSEAKCAHVLFQGCNLTESLWQDVKLSATAFDRCDFTSAQIRYMPMDGLNMTTCVLDGLRIDPTDLRGMRVTPSQGLMFCSLLGLTIVD